jgi:hypothetical protein
MSSSGVARCREPGHRVPGHGRRELGVAPLGEPGRASRPVGERPQRIAGREHLVDVVEEGRGLHERPVDGMARDGRPERQPGGNLRHCPHVADMPGRRLDRQEQSGGGGAPGNGHRPDDT